MKKQIYSFAPCCIRICSEAVSETDERLSGSDGTAAASQVQITAESGW